MPIKLKRNYNPGDNDSEATGGYPFCQILNFVQNAITFGVVVEYAFGYCEGSYLEKWTKGKGSPTRILEVDPSHVAQMWGQYPQEGETVGAAMRRLTYTHLIESGAVDGEIMNNPPLPPEEAKQEAPAAEDAAAPGSSPEAAEPAAEAPVDAEPSTGGDAGKPATEPETEQPASETPADAEAEQPAPEAPADAEAEPVPSPS